MRKHKQQKVHHRFNDSLPKPEDSDSIIAWVHRLERAARLAKGTHVRLSRAKLIKMCILLRLFVGFVERVDMGDLASARTNLQSFIDTLDAEQIPTADGTRKMEVRP